MSSNSDIQYVLGSTQFKGSSNRDVTIPIGLNDTQKELDEFDRSVVVNLSQLFDDERQSSTKFRLTSKIDLIFANTYAGTSNYPLFSNDLYYVNNDNSVLTGIWSGYPQYKEFDFFRDDFNNTHISYESKSAFTYNWTYYVSYPYENDFNRKLESKLDTGVRIQWIAQEGIPFSISKTSFNGRPLIKFTCPVNHGLNVGEYVMINFQNLNPPFTGYNGTNVFEVYSLGDEFFGSESFVFNIYDIGYTGNTFTPNNIGTFQRIIDINNSAETKSIYYVRNHQIISNVDEAIMTKAAFDLIGFRKIEKYNFSSLTPTNTASITTKESNQSYLLTFNKEFDISQYVDNLNRPITDFYITIINKGYYGWFNYPYYNLVTALRQGYKFNITDPIDPWWLVTNTDNETNIPVLTYSKPGFNFYFNSDLKSGDTIQGDFCEYNQYEQTERVISELYHKFFFNSANFTIPTPSTVLYNGYYYRPHFKMPLRAFSSYLEESELNNINSVPFYAYYSQFKRQLIWRDILSYGYIDDFGNGYNYPFLNGTHYSKNDIIFRIIPEGNINDKIQGIADPIIDECE